MLEYIARTRHRISLKKSRKACELAPFDPAVWCKRAETALELGDAEEAATSFFRSADILAREGRLREAHDLMQGVAVLDAASRDAREFASYLERRVRRLDQPAPPPIKQASPAKPVRRAAVAGLDLAAAAGLVATAIFKNPLLRRLRSDDLAGLSKNGQVIQFDVDQPIDEQIPPGTQVLLVLRGTVMISHPSSDTLSRLGAGEIVSADMVRGGEKSPTCTVEPATVVTISAATIDRWRPHSARVIRAMEQLFMRRATHLALAAHEVFADIAVAQRQSYLHAMEMVDLLPGVVLAKENDRLSGVFIVLDGELEATSEVGTVGRLHRGDVFGHLDLIAGRNATATVVASTDCRLAQLPRTVFHEMISAHPQVLVRLLELTYCAAAS